VYPVPPAVTVTPVTDPTTFAETLAPEPVGELTERPDAVILLVSPRFAVAVINLTIELVPDPDVVNVIGFVPEIASVGFVCSVTDVVVIT
jgi:hypothetical protein